MRKLIKDQEGNVAELFSVNGLIPEGFTEVPSEELADSELLVARKLKMESVRTRRNSLLIQNDKLWLIASKKGESTTGLEADAETLRDLPELAQTELDALEAVEDIQAYDCFAGLALTGDYE
jgi:hypothetical protein